MKLGSISINPEAFKDSSKEEFFKAVKGHLDIDLEEAWKLVCKHNNINPNESTYRFSESGKSSKRK